MLKYLKPVDAGLKMKRLGPNEDGGYVMPELVLEKCSSLFTYGIGNDVGYEVDFLRTYGKPVFTFDHTIEYQLPDFLNHTKEGLGFEKNMNCFINHYFDKKINQPVLLKVDIEGGEYPYFLNSDIDIIADLTVGVCIEVHGLDTEECRVDFVNMMEKLSKRFELVHTHGNTWGEIFNYNGIDILNVYELSFINKEYITTDIKPISIEFPIAVIDYSNNKSKPDFKFNFFKTI